jgi:hypothetical protein
MNRALSIFAGLICLLFFAVVPSNAALLRFDITGDLFFSTGVGVSHPVVTLLGLTPDFDPISLKASLIVDTGSEPYVENDTPTYQNAIYRNAIISSTIELNGIEWSTTRTPEPYLSEAPVSMDESSITISNFVLSDGYDAASLSLDDRNLYTTTSLFDSHTAPVNQTINGTYYEDAVVGLGSFSYSNLACSLDGYEIPSSESVFGSGVGEGIQIYLFSDGNDDQLDFGSVHLSGSDILGSGVAVSISPVPVPGAVWLLGTGILGIVGLRRKMKK